MRLESMFYSVHCFGLFIESLLGLTLLLFFFNAIVSFGVVISFEVIFSLDLPFSWSHFPGRYCFPQSHYFLLSYFLLSYCFLV
jgi:hypothetical protein